MPLFDLSTGDDGAIHAAVKALISELEAEDYRTRLLTTVMESTARALDYGLRAPKVSVATTQLARQLLDGIEMLPKPPAKTGTVFDTLPDVIAAATKAALATRSL